MISNIRFGVVNEVKRELYEKEWQLPYGYDFITEDKIEAIKVCRKEKNSECIVEMIYNDFWSNQKKEIYRSSDEKNN